MNLFYLPRILYKDLHILNLNKKIEDYFEGWTIRVFRFVCYSEEECNGLNKTLKLNSKGFEFYQSAFNEHEGGGLQLRLGALQIP